MPGAETDPQRGRVLFFMAVLHMMCHGLLSLLTPLYVAIQTDFGLDRVEPVTALTTWVAMVFSLSTLAVGLRVDRWRTKPVAGWGLCLQGLGLIGLSHAPTLGWARCWLVVSAIGAAGYHPVAARVIVGLYPEAVGRAVGLVGIGAGLGFFLGPRFSGWRTELAGWRAPVWQADAWRAPMLDAGVVALVVAAAYVLLTHEPLLTRRQRDAGALRPPRRDKLMLAGAVAVLGLLLIPRDFAGTGLETLNSLFLQRGYALGVGVVGSLLAYKGLFSLVTSPLLAWLSDHGHRLRWWAGVLLLSAGFAALVPWLPPRAAAMALVLHGVFLLANYPIFESALVERVPHELRGRAYSLILTIVGVVSAFAPKYVGRQVDAVVAPTVTHADPVLFRASYAGMALVMVAALLALPVFKLVADLGRRYDSYDDSAADSVA